MSTKMSNTLLTYDVQNGSVFSTLAYDVDFRQKIDIVLEKVRCRHNVKPIWHRTNLFTASHYLHYHYFVKENYFSNAYFQSILLPRTFGEDIYDFFSVHPSFFCLSTCYDQSQGPIDWTLSVCLCVSQEDFKILGH